MQELDQDIKESQKDAPVIIYINKFILIINIKGRN